MSRWGWALAAALSQCAACGGAPFEAAVNAPLEDAGDEATRGNTADAGELVDVEQLDAGAGEADSPDPLIHRGSDASPDAMPLEASVDAHTPPLDAQEQPAEASASADSGREAGVDAAAPPLCCHIACGTGTLPPGSGWTCAGACVLGASCSYQGACGVVSSCP